VEEGEGVVERDVVGRKGVGRLTPRAEARRRGQQEPAQKLHGLRQ